MNYTGNIYRPPFEQGSLLLQVTVGCSHNQCAFCTMYRDIPFKVESLGRVMADLEEARRFYPGVKRVFLENGDPFVLSAERLSVIANLIHEKLPRVETIAMYASIPNIRSKTDKELRDLRRLGINELNIGVESGLDEALLRMNKGYTAEEALTQLLRLKAAGIDYGANVIFGAAGPALRLENALKTAELLNKTEPYLIFTGTIHADPGCPLYEDLQTGDFEENSVEQYLEEEEAFLRALDLRDCFYFGLHPSNVVPLYGNLPAQRAEMLRTIDVRRKKLSPAHLHAKPLRRSEGAILL